MHQQQQIINQPPQIVRVNAASFGAKYASKREIWKFLSCDCGAFLSSYDTMTIFHMRDICARKRRIIYCKDVQVITVPQYEGLSIDDMLAFGEQYPEVMEALPSVNKEVLKLPRAYIANVIHTLVGEPFVKWINKRVNDRNMKVTQEKDMIEMDAEIMAIYSNSNAVSVIKGNSHNLMKSTAVRRRTKAEIQEQKRAEAQKKIEIENKLAKMEALEQELIIMKSKEQHINQLGENFQLLVDNGLLTSDGQGGYGCVESWEEHQQLRKQKLIEKDQADQLQWEMQQQPGFVPSKDRMKPNNQLELQEAMEIQEARSQINLSAQHDAESEHKHKWEL